MSRHVGEWPYRKVGAERWRLSVGRIAGGATLEGAEVGLINPSGGVWRATVQLATQIGVDTTRLAFAIETLADGGHALWDVIPAAAAHLAPVVAGLPSADPFQGGSTYSDGGLNVTGATGAVAAPAAAQATTIGVTGVTLLPGMYFSLRHLAWGWRLYRVRTIEPAVDGVQTITFRPSLREPVTAGDIVETNRPACTMYLANSDEFVGDLTPPLRLDMAAEFVEFMGPLDAI